jgi:polypyrimidine tract-binding protein 2
MESVEAATNLVTRFASSPAYIRTKPIHFQFSNRSEVKTNQSKSGGGGGGEGGSGDSQQTPNNILLVSVLNARVPVTLENIHQIFKPYGEVLKIITFLKDTVFKALVQMASVEQAINAKLLLEGKDMFQGCCHLRIGFSKLTDLTVKQNGARSRDFTVPDYTSLQMQSGFGGGGGYLFPPLVDWVQVLVWVVLIQKSLTVEGLSIHTSKAFNNHHNHNKAQFY